MDLLIIRIYSPNPELFPKVIFQISTDNITFFSIPGYASFYSVDFDSKYQMLFKMRNISSRYIKILVEEGDLRYSNIKVIKSTF